MTQSVHYVPGRIGAHPPAQLFLHYIHDLARLLRHRQRTTQRQETASTLDFLSQALRDRGAKSGQRTHLVIVVISRDVRESPSPEVILQQQQAPRSTSAVDEWLWQVKHQCASTRLECT